MLLFGWSLHAGLTGVSDRSCVNYGCRSEAVIRGSPRDSSCQEQEAWAPDLATSIMNWVPGKGPTPCAHLSCLCGEGRSEPAPFV